MSGKLKKSDGVTYKEITNRLSLSTTNKLKATVTLKLFDKIFEFDIENDVLEEQDVKSDDTELVEAVASETMVIERNVYVKRFAFECKKETDEQDQSYQPISGLITASSYLSVKTYSFTNAKDAPKCDDILQYQGKFWMIEDTSKTYVYTPRERSILHISLKALK